MQTLKVNINNTSQPAQILKEIRRKKLRKGATVKLVNSNPVSDASLVVALMILAIALGGWFKKKNEDASEQLLNNLLKDYKSADELERKIEKEYGVQIETEQESIYDDHDFRSLSLQGLAKAYDEDEPDISGITLLEPNPNYKTWKKGK